MRSVYVLSKGVVVVPDSTCSSGPWLGATRANSLQRVANRPILCHVLDALLEAGVEDAAVVVPPDIADEVSACVASEGPSGLPLQTLIHHGHSEPTIEAVRDFVGDAPCVLHRGDGLLGAPILAATSLPDRETRDAIVMVRDSRLERRRLRLVSVDQVVRESPQAPNGVAGACLLGPGALGRLSGEPAPLIDFAAITQRIERDGGSTLVHVAPGWRYYTGDTLDLLDMNRALLDRLDCEPAPGPAEDNNHLEGRVSIHPTAHVSSSSIVGPVLIGPHAWISDSYIGPHTSIAERVRIEGAELERSIVLADASVLNVGGRLVASVVGQRARVFRDFAIPRAMRLQVGDDDEVALC